MTGFFARMATASFSTFACTIWTKSPAAAKRRRATLAARMISATRLRNFWRFDMASICNDPGGRKRIVFYATDRIRPPAIRLGKVSQKKADKIRLYVEDLIGSKMLSRQPEKETAARLHKIDDRMHDRLVTVGLVGAGDRPALE